MESPNIPIWLTHTVWQRGSLNPLLCVYILMHITLFILYVNYSLIGIFFVFACPGTVLDFFFFLLFEYLDKNITSRSLYHISFINDS